VHTGKITNLSPLDSDRHCHLLVALARGAEELSHGKSWPDGVSDLLADVGRILGVNRVWLFQVLELTEKHMLMNFPFEWVDSHTRALKKMSRYDTKRWNFETCSQTYRQLVQSRRRGEWQTVIIKDLDDCDFKNYQMDQGVQSTVSMPVIVQGTWWGLLGLDDCTRPYQWRDEEIALVYMTANLISSAVLNNRLRAANRQFEILSHLTESSAWELDVNSGFCWCNSTIISSIRGLSDNISISLLQTLQHIHPNDRGEVFSYLRKQIKSRATNFRMDLRILRDNDFVWTEVIAKISLDAQGRLRKMAEIVIDIPERKKREKNLLHKATSDPLTGIANRASFESRFRKAVNEFDKQGTVFSLVLLDIDHFKSVNDTWGHDVGDQALRHVTKIIQTALRKGDFVARIGGEEFALILHYVPLQTSEVVAERIRSKIEASSLVTSAATITLTVSIGIFDVNKGSVNIDSETIMNNADKALYKAKNTGRNKVVTS